MVRATSFLRFATRAGVAFPFALLVSACAEDPDLHPPLGGADAGGSAGASSQEHAGGAGGSGTAGSAGSSAAGGGGGSAGNGGSPGSSGSAGTAGDAGQPGDSGTDAGNGDASVHPDAGSRAGPEPVLLGTAGNYVILAETAISNVPTSVITGDLGLSPNVATAFTGFTALTDTGAFWTSSEVVGSLFAADSDAPTPDALTAAVLDMQAAYTDAAGRPTPDFLEFQTGNIGGQVLTPGLYKWTSAVTIPSDVTISGDANDVWIFQISNDLTLAAAQSMILEGGAQPKNIFWQVAGTVAFEATSHSEGIFLSQTGVALGAGATANGRLLAQTAVTLSSSTISAPAP